MANPSTVPDLGRLAAEELRGRVAEPLRALRAEDAALRDEIAGLEGLEGRPRLRPPGLEPATAAPRGTRREARRHGRGAEAAERARAEERGPTVAPPPGAGQGSRG